MTWAMPNPTSRPDVVNEARTERLVAQGADFLKGLLPADIVDRGSTALDTGMQKIEQGKALNDAYQGLTKGSNAGSSTGSSTGSNAAGVTPISGPASQPATQPAAQPAPAGGANTAPAAAGAGQAPAKPGGQASGSGYKDAERKDLERLLQGAQ
jgi:hypothetical protein